MCRLFYSIFIYAPIEFARAKLVKLFGGVYKKTELNFNLCAITEAGTTTQKNACKITPAQKKRRKKL